MSVTEPAYTVHPIMHARLSRGGYMYQYEIRRGGVEVGAMSIVREQRSVAEKKTFHFGEAEYATTAEFKAAVEASIAAKEAGGV